MEGTGPVDAPSVGDSFPLGGGGSPGAAIATSRPPHNEHQVGTPPSPLPRPLVSPPPLGAAGAEAGTPMPGHLTEEDWAMEGHFVEEVTLHSEHEGVVYARCRWRDSWLSVDQLGGAGRAALASYQERLAASGADPPDLSARAQTQQSEQQPRRSSWRLHARQRRQATAS